MSLLPKAMKGDISAIIEVGNNAYFNSKNFDTAISMFRKGHGLGNKYCTYMYSVCLYHGQGVENPKKKLAFKLCLEAAESGISDAQFCIAVCYYNGSAGAEKNQEEFVKWVLRACNANHPFALNLYGVYLHDEIGDIQNSLSYITRAIKYGCEDAIFNKKTIETDNGISCS